METTTETQPVVKTGPAMEKVLLLKVMPGQMLKVENVFDWKLDSFGLHITQHVVSTEKHGDGFHDVVTVKQMWFNASTLISLAEEFVKG